MKGTILVCLREAIAAKYSRGKWDEVLTGAGLPAYTIIGPSTNVDDKQADLIISTAISILSLEEVVDIFSDYWTNTHSQKLYRRFYDKHSSARPFLASISDIHANMTKWIPDAKPPQFNIRQLATGDMEIEYKSHRSYAVLAEGLVKSACKYFNETAKVVRHGNVILVKGLR